MSTTICLMDERLAKRFGTVLRRQRLDSGLSQEELAFETDLHRTYISLLERGVRQPSLSTIFVLAEAMGCDPERLVKETRLA